MAHPSDLVYSSQSENICLPFDAYSDLLGGISWPEFKSHWLRDSTSKATLAGAEALKKSFALPQQFLLSEQSTSLCPLEILWLKWHVFSDLCDSLSTFHQDKKKPFLNLSPQVIHISIPVRQSPNLPVRWPYVLDLEHSKASRRFSSKTMPSNLSKALFSPSKSAKTLYQAPKLKHSAFGEKMVGAVSIRSFDKVQTKKPKAEDSKEKVAALASFHFISEGIQDKPVSKQDVFLVTLSMENEAVAPIEIWASEAEGLEKGLLLKGHTQSMDQAQWDAFNATKDSIFSKAKLKRYPAFTQNTDLHSLGMLLFHLLLVNASHPIEEVETALQEIIPRLPPMVQGLSPQDQPILIKRFQNLLSEYEPIFSRSALFFFQEDQETRLPEIPEPLWIEALILAFRLTTSIADFSFVTENQKTESESVFKTILPQVVSIATRLKQDLFGARSRRAEIEAVCDILRKEWAAGVTQNNGL